METIKAANRIIKEGIELLPDEAKGDFKTQTGDIFIDEAISNATAMVNKDEEKEALLEAYAIQEANRMASTLWRLQIITPELEKEYRALPTMKEAADHYNGFTNARKERMEDVVRLHKEITDEEKVLDIFKGVINGMSAKDAEKRYDEYQQQMKAAVAQGR